LIGDRPPVPRTLEVGPVLDTYQMFAPQRPPVYAGDDEVQLLRLDSADADEMYTLITLTFPGFYRRRTHEMGTYFGIRVGGELVAMAGERLCIPGLHEISGVCTHPSHTGNGYARKLMIRVMHEHTNAGLESFLHVGQKNKRAVSIYEQMEFRMSRSATLWPVSLSRSR
jgi:predicted GNAT family acetyltransferase